MIQRRNLIISFIIMLLTAPMSYADAPALIEAIKANSVDTAEKIRVTS